MPALASCSCNFCVPFSRLSCEVKSSPGEGKSSRIYKTPPQLRNPLGFDKTYVHVQAILSDIRYPCTCLDGFLELPLLPSPTILSEDSRMPHTLLDTTIPVGSQTCCAVDPAFESRPVESSLSFMRRSTNVLSA